MNARNLRRREKRTRNEAECRADVLLADVKMRVAGMPTPVDPRQLTIVAKSKIDARSKAGALFLLDRENAELALEVWGLGYVFKLIESERTERSPLDVPVVLIVGDEACVAWLGTNVLAPGGSA